MSKYQKKYDFELNTLDDNTVSGHVIVKIDMTEIAINPKPSNVKAPSDRLVFNFEEWDRLNAIITDFRKKRDALQVN